MDTKWAVMGGTGTQRVDEMGEQARSEWTKWRPKVHDLDKPASLLGPG
jgi:hypothetical protein